MIINSKQSRIQYIINTNDLGSRWNERRAGVLRIWPRSRRRAGPGRARPGRACYVMSAVMRGGHAFASAGMDVSDSFAADSDVSAAPAADARQKPGLHSIIAL